MLEAMLTFRDKQCKKEVHEFVEDAIQKQDKKEKWKRRTRVLEAQRRTFVERVRDAQREARGSVSGADVGIWTGDELGREGEVGVSLRSCGGAEQLLYSQESDTDAHSRS